MVDEVFTSLLLSGSRPVGVLQFFVLVDSQKVGWRVAYHLSNARLLQSEGGASLLGCVL